MAEPVHDRGLSPQYRARANEAQGYVLRQLASTTQVVAADALGVHESVLSRWINEPHGLRRACELLSVLGLKLIDVDTEIHDESYIAAVETLAAAALDRRRAAR